jgi:hypothetical protein
MPLVRPLTAEEIVGAQRARCDEAVRTMSELIKESMPRCATCKHWTREVWADGDGLTHCIIGQSHKSNPDTKNTLAFALDSEAYHAFLVTEATFGCVQHEAKDA